MTEWTLDVVTSRVHEAARTAHRLPPVRVQGYFNLWPAFARTEFERMVCDEAPMIHFPPSPREVDRMLEVMGWMQWLEVDDRKLVWMRADRYPWRDIARRFGCAERTAQRRWSRVMEVFCQQLLAGN